MNIRAFNFRSHTDVSIYLNYLIDHGLQYHLDDTPSDINWRAPLSDSDIKTLDDNHAKLWSYCNPWQVLDRDIKLWRAWSE